MAKPSRADLDAHRRHAALTVERDNAVRASRSTPRPWYAYDNGTYTVGRGYWLAAYEAADATLRDVMVSCLLDARQVCDATDTGDSVFDGEGGDDCACSGFCSDPHGVVDTTSLVGLGFGDPNAI